MEEYLQRGSMTTAIPPSENIMCMGHDKPVLVMAGHMTLRDPSSQLIHALAASRARV